MSRPRIVRVTREQAARWEVFALIHGWDYLGPEQQAAVRALRAERNAAQGRRKARKKKNPAPKRKASSKRKRKAPVHWFDEQSPSATACGAPGGKSATNYGNVTCRQCRKNPARRPPPRLTPSASRKREAALKRRGCKVERVKLPNGDTAVLRSKCRKPNPGPSIRSAKAFDRALAELAAGEVDSFGGSDDREILAALRRYAARQPMGAGHADAIARIHAAEEAGFHARQANRAKQIAALEREGWAREQERRAKYGR